MLFYEKQHFNTDGRKSGKKWKKWKPDVNTKISIDKIELCKDRGLEADHSKEI